MSTNQQLIYPHLLIVAILLFPTLAIGAETVYSNRGFEFEKKNSAPTDWDPFHNSSRPNAKVVIGGANGSLQCLKVQRTSRNGWVALSKTLANPQSRILIEFSFAFSPGAGRSLNLWTHAPKGRDASQLNLCIQNGGLLQYDGQADAWVTITRGITPSTNPQNLIWHRLRVLMDANRTGIDYWVSQPQKFKYPEQPITRRVYRTNLLLGAIDLVSGTRVANGAWYLIDDLTITAGADLPTPHTPPEAASGCTLRDAELLSNDPSKFTTVAAEGLLRENDNTANHVKQIIAHRGASAERPECTLSAFARAIKVGATAVEMDVRTTRDGKLYLLHDATLNRTTDSEGTASDKTLAQLKELDAGSWFDKKYQGERIPELREALQQCKTKIDVLLDLKEQGTKYAHQVAAEVIKYGDPQRTIVGVRSVEQALLFRKLLPEAKQLGLIPNPQSIATFVDAKVETIRLWPDWLKDKSLVPQIKKLGAQLHLNGTTGLPNEVLPLIAHQPFSLSADDPATLIKTLKSLMRDRQPNCVCEIYKLSNADDLPKLTRRVTPQTLHVSHAKKNGYCPADTLSCLKIVTPLYRQAGGEPPQFNVPAGSHKFVFSPALQFFQDTIGKR